MGNADRPWGIGAEFKSPSDLKSALICNRRALGSVCLVMANRTRKRRNKRPRAEQLTFDRVMWGGARPGAGRPKSPDAGVSHSARAPLASRYPVHVTVRLAQGLPPLRRGPEYRSLLEPFQAGCNRFGFRLIHYVVIGNHMHFIVEASDRTSLTRGLQGLLVRIARGLNRLWHRRGKVFADRYHDHILRTPTEVRNALGYVLRNARKHGLRLRALLDPYSSSRWFDGWRDRSAGHQSLDRASPITAAKTWLLRIGWRKGGLIPTDFTPNRP